MNHDSPPAITPPSEATDAAAAWKRVFDVAGSAVILLFALPVMVLVTLVVLLADGRPILFRQERVGRRGRTFTILKFRTMVSGADSMVDELQARNERRGPLFKMAEDPRVTRIGRFLRDSSLDELPQLFNVLRGDMSLVGPRPALPRETLEFRFEHLVAREQVRPGITGLWQISARDEAAFEAYERLDRMYVERLSPVLDARILFRTGPAVVRSAVRRLTGDPSPASRRTGSVASAPWHSTSWYSRELLDAQPLGAAASNSNQER